MSVPRNPKCLVAMSTLQASLICKPSLAFSKPYSSSSARRVCLSRLSVCRISFSAFKAVSPKSRFRNHRLSIRCTLQPEAAPEMEGEWQEVENLVMNSGESEGGLVEAEPGVSGLEAVESEGLVENEGKKSRLAVVVFAMGVWGAVRTWFEKVLGSEWFSWWPFWRQEKRLERLISEADANPKDIEKQSALLVELNKHRLWFYGFRILAYALFGLRENGVKQFVVPVILASEENGETVVEFLNGSVDSIKFLCF